MQGNAGGRAARDGGPGISTDLAMRLVVDQSWPDTDVSLQWASSASHG